MTGGMAHDGISSGNVGKAFPMSRPAGSGRPNRNRKLISLWVGETGLGEVDRIAAEHDVPRSDVIRAAIKHGLAAAERDFRKASRHALSRDA